LPHRLRKRLLLNRSSPTQLSNKTMSFWVTSRHEATNTDVRYTPKSGQTRRRSVCPL